MTGKVVMVQGTASSAGKSLFAAGLCRMYSRQGLSVAPFKSQNMALNSFVTPEGGEIGRAQAMQAEAAGIEPHVDMNPVLLKPSGEAGSQVILLGEPIGNFHVKEYYALKKKIWPEVTAALDRLRARYDLVVMEGAGSPAEINIRKHDIANMEVALKARSPVIIVADIDRGGVFASILGTYELLSEEERDLLAGWVINKFRGDESLLSDGLELVRKKTSRPVLGVMPFIHNLFIDEEDSLGIPSGAMPRREGQLRVRVIRLPRISNFTDFHPLELEDAVHLEYASNPREIKDAHVIIIPGSKETVQDLKWLKQSGLALAVKRKIEEGSVVLGICGGYQMLGRWVYDGDSREKGLELFSFETRMLDEKRTVRISGETRGFPGVEDGTDVSGYEIHMGQTAADPAKAVLKLRGDGGEDFFDGISSADGLVTGTYLHGLFDSASFANRWINSLQARFGLTLSQAGVDPRNLRESSYECLADTIIERVGKERLDAVVFS